MVEQIGEYRYSVTTRRPRRGWRGTIGHWLRQMAWRFDRQAVIEVSLSSTPPVPASIRQECIRKGLDHMARLFEEAVIYETTDRLLRAKCPGLFGPDSPCVSSKTLKRHGGAAG
ncbi:hypothetical protein E4T66_17345 [Sinimarinibacterium sp. CAU 1509]|uniref:hypothetical protein n=1 Tax=Sinimarinibacterium sp. CAU 1509 TaxID=2562283 RepID=UPI0010AC28B3|nr:hypothetical protein [Sinimarinibacterium sp. CAU 1509]TJY57176.1 hypothetical protein E4T66_17345 [Sinimarinibacterium sp. CAU 1509]